MSKVEETKELKSFVAEKLPDLDRYQVSLATKVLAVVLPLLGWTIGGYYWYRQNQNYNAFHAELKGKIFSSSRNEVAALGWSTLERLRQHAVLTVLNRGPSLTTSFLKANDIDLQIQEVLLAQGKAYDELYEKLKKTLEDSSTDTLKELLKRGGTTIAALEKLGLIPKNPQEKAWFYAKIVLKGVSSNFKDDPSLFESIRILCRVHPDVISQTISELGDGQLANTNIIDKWKSLSFNEKLAKEVFLGIPPKKIKELCQKLEENPDQFWQGSSEVVRNLTLVAGRLGEKRLDENSLPVQCPYQRKILSDLREKVIMLNEKVEKEKASKIRSALGTLSPEG